MTCTKSRQCVWQKSINCVFLFLNMRLPNRSQCQGGIGVANLNCGQGQRSMIIYLWFTRSNDVDIMVSCSMNSEDSNEDITDIFAHNCVSLYRSVPTDSQEMGSIKDDIENFILNEDSVNECNVSFTYTYSTFKKLNKRNVMAIIVFTQITLFYPQHK